jgi:hypothetical protein
VAELVSLVPDGGGEVFWAIVLVVVVLDVMVVVRVPRVAHQRLEYDGPALIEQAVFLLQEAVVVNVIMEQQRESPLVPHLHDTVKHSVRPCVVNVEQNGAWHRRRQVQYDVRQKHDVDRLADDGAGPFDVSRPESAGKAELDGREIYRIEQGRLGLELLQPLQGGCIAELLFMEKVPQHGNVRWQQVLAAHRCAARVFHTG